MQTRLEDSSSSKRKRTGSEEEQQLQGKTHLTEQSATNGFVLPDLNIPAQDVADGSAAARTGGSRPFPAVAPEANLISLLTVYRGGNWNYKKHLVLLPCLIKSFLLFSFEFIFSALLLYQRCREGSLCSSSFRPCCLVPVNRTQYVRQIVDTVSSDLVSVEVRISGYPLRFCRH